MTGNNNVIRKSLIYTLIVPWHIIEVEESQLTMSPSENSTVPAGSAWKVSPIKAKALCTKHTTMKNINQMKQKEAC